MSIYDWTSVSILYKEWDKKITALYNNLAISAFDLISTLCVWLFKILHPPLKTGYIQISWLQASWSGSTLFYIHTIHINNDATLNLTEIWSSLTACVNNPLSTQCAFSQERVCLLYQIPLFLKLTYKHNLTLYNYKTYFNKKNKNLFAY